MGKGIFNQSLEEVDEHQSVRSGVFGGYEAQKNKGANFGTFAAETSNENSLEKSKNHRRVETFGGNTLNRNFFRGAGLGGVSASNNPSLVSAGGLESPKGGELSPKSNGDLGDILNEDFVFIDEVLKNYSREMTKMDTPLSQMVKNLLKKVKGVNEDDLENVTSEIEHLTEGFTKVIGFSSKWRI